MAQYQSPTPRRKWTSKFSDAFRGCWYGLAGQSSFAVHLAVAMAVVAAAAGFGVSSLEWAILVGCITIVLTAEMLNSALEQLAKAITPEFNPHIGRALDIASAVVLVASIGSAVVGAIVFLPRLASLISL